MHKVSIAISTCNRPDAFKQCVESLLKYSPENFRIFIVDDASDPCYCDYDCRFIKRSGISRVKNKCLQLCYESGADHVFLFDDDTYPLCNDWWRPYVESELHHAMYCFGSGKSIRGLKRDTVNQGNLIFNAPTLKRHYMPNGCMLYFDRHCIKKVGGFDTNYPNKYEHTDLSRRIFNARLTPAPFIDVIRSHELIYCLDQDNAIQRSFTQKEMNDNLKSGYDYFFSQRNSKSFVSFIT